MTDQFCYTVSEIAEIFTTTEPRVRQLIKGGYLKAFRLGKLLIRKEDLLEFMQSAVGYDMTNGDKVKLEGGNL